MEQQITKRSSFTGKIGFVLAAAGSAVGLGNLWRFPYLAAQYGGGIFLLVYILLAVSFGFVLMMAEISIGRKTGKSAIDAYASLDKRFSFVGLLTAIVPMIILPYYSVIGGWVMKYIFGTATGDAFATQANGQSYFSNFIGDTWEPLIWFGIFALITAVVVFFGVEKGIEKFSKFMMPVLIVFIVGIVVYILCTTDNIWAGVKYYFGDKAGVIILAVTPLLLVTLIGYVGCFLALINYLRYKNYKLLLIFVLFSLFYVILPGPVIMPRYHLPSLLLIFTLGAEFIGNLKQNKSTF